VGLYSGGGARTHNLSIMRTPRCPLAGHRTPCFLGSHTTGTEDSGISINPPRTLAQDEHEHGRPQPQRLPHCAVNAVVVRSSASAPPDRPNEERAEPLFVLPHRQGKAGVTRTLPTRAALRLHETRVRSPPPRMTGRFTVPRQRQPARCPVRPQCPRRVGRRLPAGGRCRLPRCRCRPKRIPRHQALL
jgi:hypothetical protein